MDLRKTFGWLIILAALFAFWGGVASLAFAQTLPEQISTSNVELPVGNVPLSETADIPWGIGFRMEGVSTGAANATNMDKAVSRVYWAGVDEAKPMLRYTGSDARIDHISFSGKLLKPQPTPEKLVFLQITRGPLGIGTGKFSSAHLGISHFAKGIVLGETPTTANCDQIDIDILDASNVKTVVELNNQMAMHIKFGDVRLAGGCDDFLRVNAGGCVYVDAFFSPSPVNVIHIGSPGPGSNNGFYSVSNVKADTKAGSGFKLLVMDRICNADFVFDGGVISYDHYEADNATLIEAKGNPSIRVRDYRNLQRGMLLMEGQVIRGDKYGPHVVVENCRMSFEDLKEFIHADSKPPYTVVFRDCVGGRGQHLNYTFIRRGW